MSKNSAGSVYQFSNVPNANIPRSKLHRPSTYKTTINAGKIYPLFLDEVLPGDTFKLNVSCLARMTTLLTPIMDNLYMDWQFFFVPCRLLWDDWQRMHGEKSSPDESIAVSVPYVTSHPVTPSDPDGTLYEDTVGDYFGLPVGCVWKDGDVSALPFRGYNLIWNEWYRDENLQDPVEVKTDNTIQSANKFVLLPRGKRKDYFTGALPQPQKGDDIAISLGARAPVFGTGYSLALTEGTYAAGMIMGEDGLTSRVDSYGVKYGRAPSGSTKMKTQKAIGVMTKEGIDNNGANHDFSGLYADLSLASPVSINNLREAFQLQRLLERDARGGTRYVEMLRSHFGVVSPDQRLQRPEFLGSFTVPVNIHTVTQTSASTDTTTAQGNLSGVGTVNGIHKAFTKSFVEHGYIYGMCSIRSDLTYQSCIPRMFSRRTRFDYYYPALAHLGEQAILNKEIYVAADNTVQHDDVFGYQERWSEYKYGFNKITGKLRSQALGSLDLWHLSQKFTSQPTLNSTFIQENPPIARVVAVTSQPAFIVDCLYDLTCIRPMPLYDVPGLVDHF